MGLVSGLVLSHAASLASNASGHRPNRLVIPSLHKMTVLEKSQRLFTAREQTVSTTSTTSWHCVCVCDCAVTEFNTFRRRFLCVFKKGNTSNAFLVRCSSYESRRTRCLSRSQWSCDCVFPLSGLHWWKRWDGPVSGGEREWRQQGRQRGLDSFARCRVMRIHPDHKVRTKRCYCDTGMSVP